MYVCLLLCCAGVKGVLADYAAHQEYVRIAREIQNIKTEYQMSKMTITGVCSVLSFVVTAMCCVV